MSSSSIEGMIKFGLQSKRQKFDEETTAKQSNTKYRSPDQSHNYTALNRSRSPAGIERDQINSIIDEITNQLRTAEQLN